MAENAESKEELEARLAELQDQKKELDSQKPADLSGQISLARKSAEVTEEIFSINKRLAAMA